MIQKPDLTILDIYSNILLYDMEIPYIGTNTMSNI